VNQETGEIICTAHGKGKMPDLGLFKHSQIPLSKTIECLVDKGYQGIQKQGCQQPGSQKEALIRES